jgi:hypothetical protein
MKDEDVAKLSPEDRQEYENSLKITKTPKRYPLRIADKGRKDIFRISLFFI